MKKSEIESLSIEEINTLISQLKAYQKGCIDTFMIIRECTDQNKMYYDEQIKECELQLIKLRMGNHEINNNLDQAANLHT